MNLDDVIVGSKESKTATFGPRARFRLRQDGWSGSQRPKVASRAIPPIRRLPGRCDAAGATRPEAWIQ
jgi:hypothetical protein